MFQLTPRSNHPHSPLLKVDYSPPAPLTKRSKIVFLDITFLYMYIDGAYRLVEASDRLLLLPCTY